MALQASREDFGRLGVTLEADALEAIFAAQTRCTVVRGFRGKGVLLYRGAFVVKEKMPPRRGEVYHGTCKPW